MSKKIILYPLIASIIFHYLFLYSDRIYNHMFLALTSYEKKELAVIDENIAKLNDAKKGLAGLFSGNPSDENINELIEHFQEEKEKYLSKVSEKRSIVNGNSKKNGLKDGVAVSQMDQQFGKFSGKSTVQSKEDSVSTNDHSFKIELISRSSYQEKAKCEASYYGIGMILGPHFVVTQISENSNVAKKINSKIGDYLLGFKNSDNKFYEGNSLIPLIQKSYKNETITVILKQDGKIVENQIVLDKICYEKIKSKNL